MEINLTLLLKTATYRNPSFRTIAYRGYQETILVEEPAQYNVIPYEARYRFPYFANNIYRAGMLNIPVATAAVMATVHDSVRVLNSDYESNTRIYSINDYFPAPYISKRVKLQAISAGVELDIFYVMELNAEPKGTEDNNTGDNYFWDSGLVTLPAVTQTDDAIFPDSYSKLVKLVNEYPVFDDTGNLVNYGMVSMLNILSDNYYVARTVMGKYGINPDTLNSYLLDRLNRSWRTKDINEIYYSLSEDDVNRVIKTFNLTNFSKLEFVVYYLCDIYRGLFV